MRRAKSILVLKIIKSLSAHFKALFPILGFLYGLHPFTITQSFFIPASLSSSQGFIIVIELFTDGGGR